MRSGSAALQMGEVRRPRRDLEADERRPTVDPDLLSGCELEYCRRSAKASIAAHLASRSTAVKYCCVLITPPYAALWRDAANIEAADLTALLARHRVEVAVDRDHFTEQRRHFRHAPAGRVGRELSAGPDELGCPRADFV